MGAVEAAREKLERAKGTRRGTARGRRLLVEKRMRLLAEEERLRERVELAREVQRAEEMRVLDECQVRPHTHVEVRGSGVMWDWAVNGFREGCYRVGLMQVGLIMRSDFGSIEEWYARGEEVLVVRWVEDLRFAEGNLERSGWWCPGQGRPGGCADRCARPAGRVGPEVAGG